MKTVLAAVVAMSILGLPREASAETLMDIVMPKGNSETAATSRPRLDDAPTGTVNPTNAVTAPVDVRAEKPSYPEAILWSFP